MSLILGPVEKNQVTRKFQSVLFSVGAAMAVLNLGNGWRKVVCFTPRPHLPRRKGSTAQDGCKVVSLMHRPPLPPGNTPGTHFC